MGNIDKVNHIGEVKQHERHLYKFSGERKNVFMRNFFQINRFRQTNIYFNVFILYSIVSIA